MKQGCDVCMCICPSYVKLLTTVQEGKEVDESFIQECFPDINAPIDEVLHQQHFNGFH